MTKDSFDLASKGVKKKMRQEFADTMLEVGRQDPNLVVLIGDISHFILQPFAKACPDRFYNVGICEPAMMSMTAGLSKTGFFPVIHTIAPFMVERSFEQIKLDFGYQKLSANIISVGSAFDYSALGCTHHCYDDFALLKNVEGMQLTYPASCKEFNSLFKQTYNNEFPTYFRVPESQHGVEFENIEFGKGIRVKEGKDLTIVATGPHLKTALKSLDDLEKLNVSPEILYLHTLKPLDEKLINQSLSKTKRCLVIEEHSMYGGVSDDVLRASKNIYGVKHASINTGNKFIHAYGTYIQLCEKLGFSVDGIVRKVQEELI